MCSITRIVLPSHPLLLPTFAFTRALLKTDVTPLLLLLFLLLCRPKVAKVAKVAGVKIRLDGGTQPRVELDQTVEKSVVLAICSSV